MVEKLVYFVTIGPFLASTENTELYAMHIENASEKVSYGRGIQRVEKFFRY